MSEFLPNDDKLNKIVLEGTTGPDANFERMKEALHMEVAGAGAPPAPVPSLPPAPPVARPENYRCERIVYPRGNARVVITGMSERELDAIEARVRASFAGHD
ncbi:MAG TPA: hypothetical protein VNV41_16420 [Candidatus Acidoferrales bacterium]|jgi:hypothetical protein|nr:hypothetical protein [Candidatus Acidoferrales bacterium]